MRHSLLLVLVLVSAVADAGPKKKRGNTVVRVTNHVSSHCGGAALPEGEPMYQDSPAANMTLLIRAGKTNKQTKVIATVVTNGDGVFDVDLPKGTYCVISPSKKVLSGGPAVATPSANVDQDCLESRKRECDGVITAGSIRGRADFYTSTCFPPCYDGPMPP